MTLSPYLRPYPTPPRRIVHSMTDHVSFVVCTLMISWAAIAALVACYDQIYCDMAAIDPTYYQDDFGAWQLIGRKDP